MARILIGLILSSGLCGLFLAGMLLFKNQFYLNQVHKYLGEYQEESYPISHQIKEFMN